MWPAQEYTRVIFESPVAVPHQAFTLKDPARVVLELEGVVLTTELAQLPTRVHAADPYIAAIRFGTRPPDTLRIVFDLKTETRTQLFALLPVAEFGHRVVLDLYPLTPIDPLMALLEEKRETPAAEPKPWGAPDDRPADPKASSRSQDRDAAHHDRNRSRPWRRGSGRDRSSRHLREKRDARDR